MGREFCSGAGVGAYFSIILPPPKDANPWAMAGCVTAFSAVAVCRAVSEICGLECDIKWVNDLFVGKRKICGILSEGGGDMESGSMSYMVVGIGINTHTTHFPDAISNIAASIEDITSVAPSRPRLIAHILDQFADFESALISRDFMDEYRRRSNVLGREVTIHRGNESYIATAIDIDDNGALIVKTNNEVQTINFGEVSLRI
jgi:BirA family biotin operon repressor/biotin-[acetyl-CoA-carboxylase] ligase